MPKQLIQTAKGARPSGDHSGVCAADFVFGSGAGRVRPLADNVLAETIKEQAARTLENIKAILEIVASTMAEVTEATVRLSDLRSLRPL